MLAIGVMIWLGSEVMFFSGLFAALFTIRSRLAQWPPAGTKLDVIQAGIFTLILISSSFTMQWAVWQQEHDRRRSAKRWVWITFVLGALRGPAAEVRADREQRREQAREEHDL